MPRLRAEALPEWTDGPGIPKVIATNYDFYPLMTTAGTYQFRVRAIPKDTEETAYITSSDWVYSDELDIDADESAL